MAINDVGSGYAHLAFHDLAQGHEPRARLSALFMNGVLLGAQLALVDAEVARQIVESYADEPAMVHELAREVEFIREAAR